MTRLISLFAFALLLFAGCKPNEQKKIIPVSAELLKYFDYKPGTYWVYRDSLTGEVDSFYVVERRYYYQETDNEKLEGVSINCQINNIQSSKIDTFNYSLLKSVISMNFQYGYTGKYCASYTITTYPFVYAKYSHVGGDTLDYYPLIDDLIINGFHFYDVLKIHFSTNNDYCKYNDWIYINKDVGIVKMRLNHTGASLIKIFELVKWNIVI